MKKIICIGSSAKDIFFPTSEGVALETPQDLKARKKIVFEAGAKYHIEDRFESLGGCAVNQSVGLSRLGMPVACYTMVGNDMDGEWIRREMEKEKIGSELIMEEKCPSGLSAIIVDQNSGERIIFSNQEANERMKIEKDKIKDAEWISVSDPNGNWKEILGNISEVVSETGAKLAFNPRGKNIQEDAGKVFEIAGKAEIFFVNKDEAIEIISSVQKSNAADYLCNEEYLLQELKKSGAKTVVLTDGENGAWAISGAGATHIEARKIEKITDTTGAGDAFASAFLAAYIQGKKIEECLRWGIINGGNATTFYGGIKGLLSEKEIINKINE